MLLSLEAHCFLSSWRQPPLPELAQVRLKDLEKRMLGNLVRRPTCQDRGQRPVSLVVEHLLSNVREELVAAD